MANKSPNNAIDFNKARKRRQRMQTLRRVLILGALMAGIVGVIVLNSVMVEQGITTRISDLIGGMGGTGYPTSVPGGVIRNLKGSGNHLAVLNDTNLFAYNSKGKQTGSFQGMSDNTVLLCGDDRMLTFDAGAKRFAVHSRTKTLLERDNLEYGVIAGGMNQNGDFALVTSSKQAICEITVYNRRFADIYRCYLAENLVNTVSVSPKGSMMAAGWVNGDGGALLSGVNIYHLSRDDGPAAVLELPDELILSLSFYEDDRIGVLTDRQYFVMGTDGSVKNSYSFSGRQLTAFETEGRQVLLLCENKEARTHEIILLDAGCAEKALLETDEKVVDMALAARRAYLLTEDEIQTLDQQLAVTAAEPVQFVSHIELVNGRLYYLTREEIRVLGQKEEPPSISSPAGDEDEFSLPDSAVDEESA